MHTFTFRAGPPGGIGEDALLAHAGIVRGLLPTLDSPLETGCSLRGDEGFGWSWVLPANRQGNGLLSHETTPTHAAVVYGEARTSGEESPAALVLRRWTEGRAGAVQELEGSFSAVIVDRTTGEVHLLGDLLGHRALRFFATTDMIIASPHDLAIAATGRAPANIDYTSAASILSCEWSLGGRSMLAGVDVCEPAEVVRWRLGEGTATRTTLLPLLRPETATDPATVSEVRDRMLAAAVEATRRFLREEPGPVVDLTAGRDSRAALALVLGAGRWQGDTVQCAGAPDSLDVRYGQRIAERAGLRFRRTEPAVPTADAFLEHVDLMAFAMNGDTDSKRALAPAPTYPARRLPHFWGGGGEIFAGYYYPPPGRSRALRSNDDAVRLLRSKLRADRLPWRTPAFAEAVYRRQDERLERFATVARTPYDLLDLYYLSERFAVWGSLKERFTWEPDRYWTPFANAPLVRLAFQLPSPVGTEARLHADAVRRYLPGAYWTPVNAARLLPFERLGGAGATLNRAYRVGARLARSVSGGRSGGGGTPGDGSHERMRAATFAGPLRDTVEGVLGSSTGLSAELLGGDGLGGLLDAHRSHAGIDTLQLLGVLVTMERWHDMARSARDAAGGVTAG